MQKFIFLLVLASLKCNRTPWHGTILHDELRLAKSIFPHETSENTFLIICFDVIASLLLLFVFFSWSFNHLLSVFNCMYIFNSLVCFVFIFFENLCVLFFYVVFLFLMYFHITTTIMIKIITMSYDCKLSWKIGWTGQLLCHLTKCFISKDPVFCVRVCGFCLFVFKAV